MGQSKEWAVKLRPQTLQQMAGQESNKLIIQNWLDNDNLPNALIFYGKSGSGKALKNGTKVLTSEGYKPIEELTLNDLVASNDGKFYKLNGIYPQGIKSCYKITLNHGNTIYASGDHIWTISRDYGRTYHDETTEEILSRGYTYTEPKTGWVQHQVVLPPVQPLELPEQDLPIDPYLLGCLIGDGSLSNAFGFSSEDQFIMDKLNAILRRDWNMELKKHRTSQHSDWNICFIDGAEGRRLSRIKNYRTLSQTLSDLGMRVSAEYKHIPKQYLQGSIEQRRALLAGLMDTDGYVEKNGSSDFTSVSRQLVQDVKCLAESLGIVTKVRYDIPNWYSVKGVKCPAKPAHVVMFYTKQVLCTLPRKVERENNKRSRRVNNDMRIHAIERVEDAECTCISIQSPNHLFIAENRIPTHNTTLARMLGLLANAEVIELDAASHNSVDDARQINELAGRLSLTGKRKIFIIDECFVAGTKISTPKGPVNIEDIQPGDVVKNIVGEGKVLSVFKKPTTLSSLVEVRYNTDCRAQVTKDHLYLTQRGWVQAQYLIEGDVLYGETLSDMWKASSSKRPEDLFQAVRDYLSVRCSNEARSSQVCDMSEGVYDCSLRHSSNLLKGMQIFIDRLEEQGTSLSRKSQATNAHRQSDVQSSYCEEGSGNKNVPRNECIQKSRREWAYNQAAKIIVGELGVTLGDGVGDTDWCEEFGKRWVSDLLQGGYWSLGKEDSDRGGWRRTLLEMFQIAGCQEDELSSKFRVDSVEILEQRSGQQSSANCSGNTETTLVYDLQVEGHPSYFANGAAVHNCHMLSQQSWNVLLKSIEEPNPKVTFIFCTTEYTKLPLTIKGRSRMLKFYSIPREQQVEYAKAVLEHEGYTLSDEVIDLVVDQSNGQMRDLLKLLQTTCEANLDDVAKLKKFLAIPDNKGMRNFINAVLSGNPKNGVKVLNEIDTDLLEWIAALQKHIYQLLEDKYGITPINTKDITTYNKIRALESKFTDRQFGALLTELNKINRAETAYAQLYALLFRGIDV